MIQNPLFVFDFTAKAETNEQAIIRQILKNIGKKWAFQREKGKSGYDHYQCRVQLQTRSRKSTLINRLQQEGLKDFHLSETHDKGTFRYVLKDESRIEGPWTDKDIPLPIHLQMIRDNPYEWQKKASKLPFDMRKIHFIHDPDGNNGKTQWAILRRISVDAVYISAWTEDKEVVQQVFAATNDRPPFSNYEIIIDLPRVKFGEKKMTSLYFLLEAIKNGRVFDSRYSFKEAFLGPSRVIVLSNHQLSPGDKLSQDRAKFYRIDQKDLKALAL